MATIMTPGVYMLEVASGTRPIESVGTGTTAFVGLAPSRAARSHEAVAVNNWPQFCKIFVGESEESTPLSCAVYGFFENGGSRCYVVNVGEDGGRIVYPMRGGQRRGIAKLEEVEAQIVVAPGCKDVEGLISHCEFMGDRVAIVDGPETAEDIDALLAIRTEAAEGGVAPPSAEPKKTAGLRPRNSKGGFAAFYFPWITVQDPLSSKRRLINVPPSGHLAGIYASTDATRGVHKAPANVIIRGALNLSQSITPQEQGPLNQAGVNCIRMLGGGITVWGCRTLDDSASEWRYINVRRLFNMIKESIQRGTRAVVFEPNDLTLWKSIRRDVSLYLTSVWRTGALVGKTPAEAFFVKCDAENNPPEEVDAGRVNIDIGVAPVKPAEFVIFRIGQYSGGAQETNEGDKEASNG